MSAKKEMSFLPEEDNVNSFSVRAVKWITTVGRVVIVITEFVVIGAFLSRFWLDRTNADLSESIRQQKAILQSTGSFEKEYTSLQKRLKLISNFYQNQPEYQSKIITLTESTPLDITFDRLSLNKNLSTNEINASVSLFAYNESSIIDFITNLISNPKISSVNIQSIEKKSRDNKYNVSLSLIFSKDKK